MNLRRYICFGQILLLVNQEDAALLSKILPHQSSSIMIGYELSNSVLSNIIGLKTLEEFQFPPLYRYDLKLFTNPHAQSVSLSPQAASCLGKMPKYLSASTSFTFIFLLMMSLTISKNLTIF